MPKYTVPSVHSLWDVFSSNMHVYIAVVLLYTSRHEKIGLQVNWPIWMKKIITNLLNGPPHLKETFFFDIYLECYIRKANVS